MKIIVSKEYNVLRDGGSHMHAVLNSKNCGYVQVIQSFAIRDRNTPNYGMWYGMLPPPNHLASQHVQLNFEDLEFV